LGSFHLCLFSYCTPCPLHLHSFPTRRSSDLDSPAKRGKSRKPWIISAVVVVVLAAAGGAAAWISGMFTDEVLDQESLHEGVATRSEEHTSELQSRENLVCRLLLEKKKI